MDEPIVIPRFALTRAEFSSLQIRTMLPRLILPAFFAASACGMIMTFMGYDGSVAMVTTAFGFPVLFGAYMLSVGPRAAVRPSNASLFLDRDIIVSNQGITQSVGGMVKTEASWSFILRVEARPQFFLLHFGSFQSFVIPRRVLSSEMEQQLLMIFYAKGRLKPATR